MNLNILLDAEVSKLRDTIRAGLTAGQWDMKVGDRLFIKTDDGISPPDIIEFSERMELYRRGILQPPEPREIELSAQVMPSSGVDKTVRVRWRAKGALTVTLYQEGALISGEFRPSDEYEGTIQKNTLFRIVADYGKGETAETQTQAILSYGGGTIPTPNGAEQGTVFQVKPQQFDLNGTPNSVFNDLSDRVSDYKVQGISSLELSVAQVVDYRKLGTTLPLLARFPMQIDQTVTIQSGDRFVRLEY